MSGAILPDSVPGRVVQAGRDGRLTALASWDLAAELVEALRRPKLERYEVTETDIASLLLFIATQLPEVDVEVELRDPADAKVVAAAVAGRADLIVTGDRDLLDDLELHDWLRVRGIAIETPASLVDRLGLP